MKLEAKLNSKTASGPSDPRSLLRRNSRDVGGLQDQAEHRLAFYRDSSHTPFPRGSRGASKTMERRTVPVSLARLPRVTHDNGAMT
jgi:hypothetical protein